MRRLYEGAAQKGLGPAMEVFDSVRTVRTFQSTCTCCPPPHIGFVYISEYLPTAIFSVAWEGAFVSGAQLGHSPDERVEGGGRRKRAPPVNRALRPIYRGAATVAPSV